MVMTCVWPVNTIARADAPGSLKFFHSGLFLDFFFFLPVSGMGFPFFLIFIFFIHPGAAASSTSATTAAASQDKKC